MNGGPSPFGTLLTSPPAAGSAFVDILADLEKSVEKELAHEATGLKLRDICIR